jgi:HAD superfamily hydrolase (TIGR01509 family)
MVATPRMYELVIFDCDGVLVDSEPIANRVLAEQLTAIGLSMSVEEAMAQFVGRTRTGCLDLATQLRGRPLPDGFGQSWDAALFDALAREVRAVAGISELLERVDLPYCVASNGTAERMRLSLKAAGLLPLFEGRMFSATEVARPKPAPDLFLHAARAMNASPSECVVIEDTATGVEAGVAAAMTVLAYARDPIQGAKLKELGGIPFDAMSRVFDLLVQTRAGSMINNRLLSDALCLPPRVAPRAAKPER